MELGNTQGASRKFILFKIIFKYSYNFLNIDGVEIVISYITLEEMTVEYNRKHPRFLE